jgi:XTP/dITP diphosphohydrolase
MQKLLIATHNPAKVAELTKYLSPLMPEKEYQIVSLADIELEEEPEETGKTIKDNAILKAQYYGDISGLPSLADDGGFMIDALNGEPGVKSNRWLGPRKATDEELIEAVLERMKDVPEGNRQAKMALCLCYYNPIMGTIETVETALTGHVAFKPNDKYIKGFPFRALHIVDPFNKYYDELTEAEHEQVNHRRKAVLAIADKIKEDLAHEEEEIVIETDL